MEQTRVISLRAGGRGAPLSILASLALFVVLIGAAMLEYPGGNAWDATARGHDFWLNYLCDLERHTALDGSSNATGARFAQAAMIALGLGCFRFWNLLPELFDGRARLAAAVRRLGAASSVGTIAVALLPADEFSAVHPFLMLSAGGTAIAAAVCGVVGLGERRSRVLQAIGIVTLAVGAVDLGLYCRQLFVESPAPVLVAVLERLALIFALTWIAAIAVTGLRSAAR